MHRGHARNLRIGRWSSPGGIYFITFTTHKRRRLFESWDIARIAAQCINDPRTWGDSRLLSWVLMPDHFHGLVSLGTRLDLSRTVARTKVLAGRQLRASCDVEHPVWARNFHDRAIRHETDIRPAARYLVANPLRAGLVERVGDYPFWNASWLIDNTPL